IQPIHGYTRESFIRSRRAIKKCVEINSGGRIGNFSEFNLTYSRNRLNIGKRVEPEANRMLAGREIADPYASRIEASLGNSFINLINWLAVNKHNHYSFCPGRGKEFKIKFHEICETSNSH